MSDLPAFEVINTTTGAAMRVYADGRREGFPDDYTVTINRIPLIVAAACGVAYREREA